MANNQQPAAPKAEEPTLLAGPSAVSTFLEAIAPKKKAQVSIQTPLDIEKGNPFDADYYSEKRHNFQLLRGRSLSIVNDRHEEYKARPFLEGMPALRRRLSHDEFTNTTRTFRVAVNSTLKALEDAEDTDRNGQITLEDSGPKSIVLGTAASYGFNGFNIRGTYLISNLYQELTIAKAQGRTIIFLDEERINENPVNRLSRLIHQMFWPGLTRTLDGSSIHVAARDPKAERFSDPRPRVYVPATCKEQIRFYTDLQKTIKDLDVCILPEDITPEYVFSINDKPGILALDMQELDIAGDGNYTIHGLPFVVPGGRFNELYGWDSYFMALGLLQNETTVHLAYSMVVNFIFEIQHYGKILNANRSYYLSRSQPPFLTDMAIQTYHKMTNDPNAEDFLRDAILAAIKEYFNVWMALPRLDKATGLSRYRPDGIGIPPETEASHFDSIMKPFAEKHGVSLEQFQDDYNFGRIKEPELDEYFLHDRAVRESGHDTTYRLDGVCADLATIDLQSLLYKYEMDIARMIREKFNDRLVIPKHFRWKGMVKGDEIQTSTAWDRRARRRKQAVDRLLWDDERGMYFDYNTKLRKRHHYESATTFWPLWAGLAEPQQAAKLVANALPLFEKPGGLVSGTERSRGVVGLDRPNRQWDFPYGWAPHQMLAWKGLKDYGFLRECHRLCLRWLSMMLKSFIYYHGIVVEKYDVLGRIDPHRVDAEYGNQGADIRGAATEGFGWVNASFQVGLSYLNTHMKRCLATQMEPDKYFAAIDREEYWDNYEHAIEDEEEPETQDDGQPVVESPLSDKSCYF